MSDEPVRSFVISAKVKPKAAPRPRGAAGRQSYMPKEYMDWKDVTAILFRQAWMRINRGRPITEPVSVSLYLQPDSITAWIGPVGPDRRRVKGVVADVDNLAKACLDALVQAGVFGDDRQVEQLYVGFGDMPDTRQGTP